MRERLDPSFITSSRWRTTLVRLVIVRAMIIIVPLLLAFALGAIPLLMTVLNPVACVPDTDDVSKVLSTLTLDVLI
jgi:hypothetical protein